MRKTLTLSLAAWLACWPVAAQTVNSVPLPSASVTGLRKSAGAGSTDTAATPGVDFVQPIGTAPIAIKPSIVSPPTSSLYGHLYQSATDTAESINANQVPSSWFNIDGYRSVITVLANSSARNSQGYGYYIRNETAQSNSASIAQQGAGGQANVVGFGGIATCEVAGCATWAENPTLTDTLGTSALPSNQSYSAKLIGNETDISVRNPGTTVQGRTILGSSVVAPAFATYDTCGSLGGPALWDNCYTVIDGVAKKTGVYLGSVGATGTASSPSTTINLVYYSSSSTTASPSGGQIQLQAVLGALNLTDTTKANGIAVAPAATGSPPSIFPTGTDANSDLAFNAKGTGAIKLNSPTYVTGALVGSSYVQAPVHIETLSTPASSSASCAQGQFGDDANYHYVCVATNTWKRVALSAF